MRKILVMASACLLFAACGNSDSAKAPEKTKATVTDTHNAANSLDYLGTYVGIFPAADGPGIATTLTLKADSTFTLRSVYIDRDSAFDDKGCYSLEGNLITLKTQDGENQYYKVEEKRLRRLDTNKQEITGALADNYILTKE